MLKVEVGYYDFFFKETENNLAYDFAKCARDHIADEDKKARITITFEDVKEDEK